ncbi:unnamed protein product [Hydatigera taeniaeformis]|uniref:Histone H2A n=1 Tax=Hydatigena taeniaeformis TaxID=6205 RepID=A0A0R3XDN9_HYDTA|nr:unnamed protein product [Hydatigera taeniaeformis]
MLLRGNCTQCVSDKARVCLATVLEYLVAELVDVACGVAVDNERGRGAEPDGSEHGHSLVWRPIRWALLAMKMEESMGIREYAD